MSHQLLTDDITGTALYVRKDTRRGRIKARVARRCRRRKTTSIGGMLRARKSFNDMFCNWRRKEHRRQPGQKVSYSS